MVRKNHAIHPALPNWPEAYYLSRNANRFYEKNHS